MCLMCSSGTDDAGLAAVSSTVAADVASGEREVAMRIVCGASCVVALTLAHNGVTVWCDVTMLDVDGENAEATKADETMVFGEQAGCTGAAEEAFTVVVTT